MVSLLARTWSAEHFALVEKLILDSNFNASMKFMVRLVDGVPIVWETEEDQSGNWK